MIFNIYKPVGWTSFDVVKKIRNITREKKVGHGGTLDPFAEGVLIIGTGNDTKVLEKITGMDKSYTAVLKLGTTTDTLDVEGTITETASIPDLTEDQINSVLSGYVGKQDQIPPMYSAKQVNGVRLYKLARKQQKVKRSPVPITVYSLQLIEQEKDQIAFSVTCSKGTYIRVLGKDIARSLGTVGYLTNLVRTSVGEYVIDDSMTIKTFQIQWSSTVI